MSISRRTSGAIHRYLTKLTTSRIYRRFEHDVEMPGKLPKSLRAQQGASRDQGRPRHNMVAPTIPVRGARNPVLRTDDGHDYDVLVETLRTQALGRPRAAPRRHEARARATCPPRATAPASTASACSIPTRASPRRASAQDVLARLRRHGAYIGERMPHAVAVTAAMTDNTGLTKFAKQFPTGSSTSAWRRSTRDCSRAASPPRGLLPLTTIYSTFLQRGFDQIIHDAAVRKTSRSCCASTAPASSATTARAARLLRRRLPAHDPRHRGDAAAQREEPRDMMWDRRALAGLSPDRGALYPRSPDSRRRCPTREPRLL